jgi:hypothetical protein
LWDAENTLGSIQRKDHQNDDIEEHYDGGCRVTDDGADALPGKLKRCFEEGKKKSYFVSIFSCINRWNFQNDTSEHQSQIKFEIYK